MAKYTAILTRDKDDGGWVAQVRGGAVGDQVGGTITEARSPDKPESGDRVLLQDEAGASLKKAGRRARIEHA